MTSLVMAGEYATMGIYPKGRLMRFMRPRLDSGVLPTTNVIASDVRAIPSAVRMPQSHDWR